MFLLEANGRPLYVNDAYLRMLGESKEEHAARGSTLAWTEHIHQDDLPRFHDAWQRVLDQRAPMTFEHRLKKVIH